MDTSGAVIDIMKPYQAVIDSPVYITAINAFALPSKSHVWEHVESKLKSVMLPFGLVMCKDPTTQWTSYTTRDTFCV